MERLASHDEEAVALTSVWDSITITSRETPRVRLHAAVWAVVSVCCIAGTGTWCMRPRALSTSTSRAGADGRFVQQKFVQEVEECSDGCENSYKSCSRGIPSLILHPSKALWAKAKCVKRNVKCKFSCMTRSAKDSTRSLVSQVCRSIVPKASGSAGHKEHDSLEVTMAKIASHVYRYGLFDVFTEQNLNISWEMKLNQSRVSGITGMGRDAVELFQSRNECALAFSGSDDLEDVEEDAEGFSTTILCGVALHEGFLKKLLIQTRTQLFQDSFVPFLKGPQCAGGVYGVGHSLGGALATILAGCSMRPDAPESIRGINVTGLYTFGAPGVSKPSGRPGDTRSGQLSSATSGCFKGKRFWNTAVVDGVGAADPIPSIAALLGFVHPLVTSVNLNALPFGKVEKEECSCTSHKAKTDPQPSVVVAPDMSEHPFCLYANRVEAMY